MTELEFETRYRETLLRIEDAIEASGADLDYESSDEVISIDCPDGSAIIITRQTATRQLWLAARSGGFHFDWDEGRGEWVCDSNDRGLDDMLRQISREQCGDELELSGDR